MIRWPPSPLVQTSIVGPIHSFVGIQRNCGEAVCRWQSGSPRLMAAASSVRMCVYLLFVSMFMSGSSSGADGAHRDLNLCDGIEHDANRAHVQLDVDQLPNIDFYADQDLHGTPVLQLNDRGLFAGELLLCGWPNGRFEETPEPNRVLDRDQETRCTQGPIRSGFGDNGAGTAVLCIEIVRHTDEFAQADFRGAPVYFSLRSLPIGKWSLEPSSESDVGEWRTYHSEKFGYELQYPACRRLSPRAYPGPSFLHK